MYLLMLILCQELPKEGVKIFQGLLHSHLLGASLSLRHIRDGQELPVIMKGESAGAELPDFFSLSTSEHLRLIVNICFLLLFPRLH